ncbi:TetR/AcrR family transcriptional regulator [Nocardia sp. NBC_01329]|uniref:TetR/AcrR family transcriptional regulator n=1 Tax=Nocardia sp. NBC_01329 TaxID=2903594 RepID=UPI002E0D8311|nr:TetR/AcrR family transcriptional regulator [Nocardia sp. NBC_01329]
MHHTGSSSPAGGLRERKKQATREALISAATQLFLRRGLAQTTIADIAAAADVAPRTFFLHFASKEDVLFHYLERYGDTAVDAIAQLRPGATPQDGVHSAVLSMIELYDAPEGGADTLAPLRVQLMRDSEGFPASLAARLSALQKRLLDALYSRFPEVAGSELVATHLGAACGAVGATAMHRITATPDLTSLDLKEAMLLALKRASAGFTDLAETPGETPP